MVRVLKLAMVGVALVQVSTIAFAADGMLKRPLRDAALTASAESASSVRASAQAVSQVKSVATTNLARPL